MDEAFWAALEEMVRESRVIVDRPRGSRHPRYQNMLYELDYGYLEDTHAMDGQGIDVWRGSAAEDRVDGVVVTVDLMKKDAEIKVLLGCNAEEMEWVRRFHSESGCMKGLLIVRRAE